MRLVALIPLVIALVFPAIPALADIAGRPTIIDGDTIKIAGERIRLNFIDAPETPQQCRANGKPWGCGQAATYALAGFIGKSRVRCETHGRGKYGRLLGTCYLGETDINAWMVRSGWAVDYRKYSSGAYAREESLARGERRGIWKSAFIAPWDWRRGKRLTKEKKRAPCLIKGNISRSEERIYHVPGGVYYSRTGINPRKGERWFCSEAEARAEGWRRSKR